MSFILSVTLKSFESEYEMQDAVEYTRTGVEFMSVYFLTPFAYREKHDYDNIRIRIRNYQIKWNTLEYYNGAKQGI